MPDDAPPPTDRRGLRPQTWVAAGVALFFAVGLTTWWTLRPSEPEGDLNRPLSPIVTPTTAPATVPATEPISAAPPPATFFEVVKADFPTLPATRPFDAAGELEDAARIVLDEPLYLDPAGRLWITRPDAPPAAEAIDAARQAARKGKAAPSVYVVRDRVAYVHYAPDPAGGWRPIPILQAGPGRYEWLAADGPKPLPDRAFDFSRAFSWGERVVVPTAGGASVLTVGRAVHEDHIELMPPAATRPSTRRADLPPTRFVNNSLDDSLLAWVPWTDGRAGGSVARYVAGKWSPLGKSDGIVPEPVQLVPLLDGSLLQIGRAADGGKPRMDLDVALLTAPVIDEAKVMALVKNLSAPLQTQRDAAYAELTQYGPPAWPLLERVASKQPPEARIRIRALLGDKQRPTLGDMAPYDGPFTAVSWLADGGVVLYLANGVSLPDVYGSKETLAPAWIAVRPGRPIRPLPPSLTTDVNPDKASFYVWGDETIVSADADGPQRFYGNHRRPILGKPYAGFSHLVGIDADGRWLFRKPAQPDGPTLILDPRLPDPTPRLPAWEVNLSADRVGRSPDGWPVFQSGGTWMLQESGWVSVGPKQAKKVIFGKHLAPPSLAASHRKPTSAPSTNPSTKPATEPAEPPLLTDGDGTRYFGGATSLRTLATSGADQTYPLPAKAQGSATDAALLRAADGCLYLFNQPGRVVRLMLDPKAERVVIEGLFTEGIPNAGVEQIWLDPAGRIAVAHAGNRLTLLFPAGRVPPALRTLMVDP